MKILVVEDSRTSLALLTQNLTHLGTTVFPAAAGEAVTAQTSPNR